MSTAAVPVFVTLRLCVAVLPTATLPNASVVALAERMPELGCVEALVKPAQLVSEIAANTTATVASRLASERRSDTLGSPWVLALSD